MPGYTAPLRDYRFCLHELFAEDGYGSLPDFAEFTPDVADRILEAGARFSEDILFPLNRRGDAEGCRLSGGEVLTPAGFKEAYRHFRDGGWPGLTCDPAHGGQGLPHVVNFIFEEMMGSANLSFCLYPGLTRGCYICLERHGSEKQKFLYLPKLASGEWAGAMCLTEAHCGTDLGLLKTRAKPNADGSYSISGSKVFISAGDHDLTANIIYLVLARLPDAPRGTRGISLFLVPKFLASPDQSPGERNAVSCGALEDKMGIHGCSTCVINFDGALGFLVGRPNEGLKAMFSLMNTERIGVGVQGLAIAEASYQNAVAHARERLQGRAASGAKAPEKPADPIIVHADVRRMLLTQRALTEGCRMLVLWTASALDQSLRHGDAARRGAADEFVALMTPLVKAFLTDCGSECANLGLQVLGGHGYIRANGQEQFVRDVRVTQIYEGTNGVQCLDLLNRKVLQLGLLDRFLAPAREFAARHRGDERLSEFVEPLQSALARLEAVTEEISRRSGLNADEAGAAATGYLRLFGLTALAHLWARAAVLALPRSNEDFYRAKILTARFFAARILPETVALDQAIRSGAASIMEFDQELF